MPPYPQRSRQQQPQPDASVGAADENFAESVADNSKFGRRIAPTNDKQREENENGHGTTAAKDEHDAVPATAAAASLPRLPLTVSLPLLVMLDMVGVSLVVPLLHQYFKLAGVANARQRELLSSLYSSSQIAGGLALGALSDSGLLSRRNTLILSFVGSALAYFLVSCGGLAAMVVSRVIVGLVKQTMTVSTAIMARHTSKAERATQVGRLTASSTVAWIVGPSVGAFMFKHVDPFAPVLLACFLFLLNTVIALVVVPNDGDRTSWDEPEKEVTQREDDRKSSNRLSALIENFKACFRSNGCLASVVGALLIFQWVTRTTSYANISSYYEEMYGIEPHQRGYMQSYRMGLSFVAQSFLVRPILTLAGGEVNAACCSAIVLAIVTFIEIRASFWAFICLLCPIISMCVALLGISLRSVVTKVAPKDSLGSVFAAIDVLQNAAAVTVPFYRTVLFSVTRRGDGKEDEHAEMIGDPEPRLWLLSSGIHWLVATVALCCLLLKGRPCAGAGGDRDESKKDSYGKCNGDAVNSSSDKVKTQ